MTVFLFVLLFMILTLSQFNQKFQNNELRLAFIGMSNIGKSMHSKGLINEKQFICKSIDDDINQKLNLKTEEETAQWLGFPFNANFNQRQTEYLTAEDYFTNEVQIPQNENFLLDTTGSVVYTSEPTQQFLKENFLIIHFTVPDNLCNEMMAKYFAQPKPIIWGNSFDKKNDETNEEALKKCYPQLLEFRTKKYQTLANISIDCFRDVPMSHSEFWDLIKRSLK